MSGMKTVALYGLEVPPGSILIPAMMEDSFPDASFRITMAALDPTEEPEADEDGKIPSVPRSTLKIVRQRYPDMEDEVDDEYLESLVRGGSDDDEEDSDEEEEANGGPSDPSKSKKAKQAAALKKLIAAAQEESDEEMADAKTNGKAKKGKQPATSDDEEEDEDSEDDEDLDLEENVICTLDTERNYQQTLDITISPEEKVFFIVQGTHTVHLTGNYIVDADDFDSDEEDEDDDEYDDFPEELEAMYGEGSDESEDDELDGLEDPRIMEIDDDDEAPKLVAADSKKGKKRAADEEAETLDSLIAKSDTKLSKKQQKKLKNNKGDAVEVEDKAAKESPKDAKKVQFAKNLEQGPTGPAAEKEKDNGPKPGIKVVQGVTIDDRKIGSGRAVKKGNKVGVRYIGKLQDGKVFDSNKKGKPFQFTAGSGQVIRGWDVGVMGMSVGGERRLTIPASLAYGSKSQPGIPGNSTLVFDIKLLEIK
ncbi:FK506-binding protein 4 [Apiospora sp. TS-2023a]